MQSSEPIQGRRPTVLVANPSADLYGSDRMMLEAVRGFVERDWRVVVAHSSDGPLVDHLRGLGAEVVSCPAPVVRKSNLTPAGVVALGKDTLRGMRPMRRLIRDVRPDLLYVSTVTIPLWLAVAKASAVPSVLHIHEAEAGVPAPARIGLNLPSHLATRVIFNSATSKAVARPTAALERRSRIIHNGVAAPPRTTEGRESLGGQVRLLYVGRLSPRKGVDLVISAVTELAAAGLDATLVVVGAVFPGYEWYEEELKAQVAANGIRERVSFRGFRDSVWDEMSAADIVVVPSRSDESFGNTVIEGVLAQRPVVAADHSGLAEARQGLAAVVPFENDSAAALAAAIMRVVGDWEHFRGAAVRDAARAGDEYSPQRFRGRVLRVAEEAVRAVAR